MICRGDIYYAKLNPVQGSEQGGLRPVLVIQNDKGNKHCPTVIIAPITSKGKKYYLPTHVILPDRLEPPLHGHVGANPRTGQAAAAGVCGLYGGE